MERYNANGSQHTIVNVSEKKAEDRMCEDSHGYMDNPESCRSWRFSLEVSCYSKYNDRDHLDFEGGRCG